MCSDLYHSFEKLLVSGGAVGGGAVVLRGRVRALEPAAGRRVPSRHSVRAVAVVSIDTLLLLAEDARLRLLPLAALLQSDVPPELAVPIVSPPLVSQVLLVLI